MSFFLIFVVGRSVSGAILYCTGEYRLYDYLLYRTDPQGDRWRLQAGATQASPLVKAVANATTPLVFGEPFTPMVGVGDSSRQRFMKGGSSGVSIFLRIEGLAQETVSDVRRVKGGKTKIRMSTRFPFYPEEATYKVIQPNGEMVAHGHFEYG